MPDDAKTQDRQLSTGAMLLGRLMVCASADFVHGFCEAGTAKRRLRGHVPLCCCARFCQCSGKQSLASVWLQPETPQLCMGGMVAIGPRYCGELVLTMHVSLRQNRGTFRGHCLP